MNDQAPIQAALMTQGREASNLELGLVGNCTFNALIDHAGAVVWCCMPRFDSPSIFTSLLGNDDAGYWSVEPSSPAGTTEAGALETQTGGNSAAGACTFVIATT